MKNLCAFLLAFWVAGAAAQQVNEAVRLVHYVYPSFVKGTVREKSGGVSEQELNYNIITGEMIFNQNGQYLAIARPEQVDTIYLEGRKWVPVKDKFYEVLTFSETPLFEEFGSTVKEPGASNGYGTTSGTTAAVSLQALIQNGSAYRLELPADFKVIPRNVFWVRKAASLHKINGSGDLGRIFPDKKAAINDWVKKNKTRFSNRDDLVALMQHLE